MGYKAQEMGPITDDFINQYIKTRPHDMGG